ncbi:Sec-independent protein translocase protein TatB [Viridibacterium curvum]|uniref:Sec-independent protein translocase protein TatB n=1 Tax=Viridibacterium curvum TaxID=1101404 RepID=A0ABP9Q9J6_9RHOO
MFDIGISELGVIGVVALIVIGPEQLPRVARTAGHLLGRLRRYVSDVKSDISREMELADFKRMQEEIQTAAGQFEQNMNQGIAAVNEQVGEIAAPVVAAAQEVSDSANQALQNAAAPDGGTEDVPAVDENQPDLFALSESAQPAPAPKIAPDGEKH